ncbi:MAG: MBL fold metallo-hydrolase [Clostridiales bacterium]|nr:MBL fold metallo-hydrolase [Clostridiales bacterium]
MKLTFLGTGTSTGIPVLGCNCDVCRSTDPKDKRLRTSSLLTLDDGSTILIDCGPDMRTQLLKHHNAPLSGIVITHSHYDHVGGIDDLRTLSYPYPAKIYCRKDVADDLHRLLPYCFNNSGYPNIPRLELNIVKEYEPFTVAGVEILPLAVMHGKLHILGYRIGNLAYITDSTELPQTTVDAIKGIDTLVINALRITPNRTHMNLEQALAAIERIKPRQAFLIHMSHQMGLHNQASQLLPPGIELAYDSLEIELNP